MKKGPIIAVSLLVIIIAAWFVVSRMPFGGSGDRPVERAELETIAEGTVERGSDMLAPNTELQDEAEPAPPPAPATPTTTTSAPPATATTTASAPPASPAPRAAPADREITEEQAVAVLRGFIASNEQYVVRAECLRIGSLGYRNVGYTLEVFDTCSSPGAPRSRWRVDSKTREVFLQHQDGRYLRP